MKQEFIVVGYARGDKNLTFTIPIKFENWEAGKDKLVTECIMKLNRHGEDLRLGTIHLNGQLLWSHEEGGWVDT